MRSGTSGLLAAGRGLGLPLLVLLPLLAGPAQPHDGPAQAHRLFDTTNVLAEEGNACLGEPDCKQVAADPVRIEVDETKNIALRCPAGWPNLQGWDVRRHEHIGLDLLSRSANGLTVAALNHADAPGKATLIAGCSKRPHHPTAVLVAVHPVPSKALKGRRE
jgi:hypothetical protein